MKLYETKGEFKPDGLIADNEFPIMARGVVVAAGQGILKRGTLLGIVDGKGYLTGTTKEEAVVGVTGILTDDINAEEDFVANIYITGVFNPAALVTYEDVEVKELEDDLKKIGIYLKSVQEY